MVLSQNLKTLNHQEEFNHLPCTVFIAKTHTNPKYKLSHDNHKLYLYRRTVYDVKTIHVQCTYVVHMLMNTICT